MTEAVPIQIGNPGRCVDINHPKKSGPRVTCPMDDQHEQIVRRIENERFATLDRDGGSAIPERFHAARHGKIRWSDVPMHFETSTGASPKGELTLMLHPAGEMSVI